MPERHNPRECWCGIDHSREHHVTVEAQTWSNTPPYRPQTMYRAACRCGWTGMWHSYKKNVESGCPNAA